MARCRPGAGAAVADVAVVVGGVEVVRRVAAAVATLVVDGVEPRFGPEAAAVGLLGVLPHAAHERQHPGRLGAVDVVVEVDRHVVVVGDQLQRPDVLEPVLLPGRRAARGPLPGVTTMSGGRG